MYLCQQMTYRLEFIQQQSATENSSKCKICPLNCPLDEAAILQLIMDNSGITQKKIACSIGKSERTVKNKVALLKEKGYIQRLNGKRNGKCWFRC